MAPVAGSSRRAWIAGLAGIVLGSCGTDGTSSEAASEPSEQSSPAPAATTSAAAPDTLDENLLTTAKGATVVLTTGGEESHALGLIDGDPDDGTWTIDHPREKLPATIVFELLAPVRLDAVGVDNVGPRPGGVVGGAARSIRFEGSATGAEEGFVPLAALEAEPDARTVVPVSHSDPVRWVRVTIESDHGGGTWVYLDEVIALGEMEPAPSDDGRFEGVFQARGNVLYELVQEGSLLTGCYTGTSRRGGGSLGGSVSGGIARLEWIDGTNPVVRGTALFVIDSADRLKGVWYRLPGRSPVTAAPAEQGTTTFCSGTAATNPVAAALEASGEAILYGIYFDFDRDVLKPESEPVLRQLHEALQSNPDLVADIEGHTDAVGADAYNQDLSARRAAAVVAWLTEQGIAPDRLNAVGKGEAEPVASNDTADGRALNRRVEVRRR
jgi:outer membrane protein OmpA-like peptidoglycan-associated protein